MKLYIFAPSKKWMYMGGVIVAIADAPERAFDWAIAQNKDFYGSWCLGDMNGSDNEWYLVEQFDTTETKERVVLIDYNEA